MTQLGSNGERVHRPRRPLRQPLRRRIRATAGGAALVAVAAITVACAPSSEDSRTRTASQLGLGVARVEAAGPTVPVAPAPPTPSTAVPPTTPPTTAPAPAAGSYITAGTRLGVGGCALFPRDNVFHATITALPNRADSAATIAAVGPATSLMAGFGSGLWQGSRPGYPVNVLDARTAATKDLLVGMDYAATSEPYGVPWPDVPRFEGWPGRAWDKHLLVVDSSSCRSWETINTQPPSENVFGTILNRWYADKVVTVDLSSNVPRPGGTVTASGFSMLAGLVRYDEVASGNIDHVLAMSLPGISNAGATWPAQATDGRSTDPSAPKMGSWFRLRSDVNLSGLGPQASVVAGAMRDHGVVLVDTGPNAAISGEPDLRWNDADLGGLTGLTMSDFEVVDPSAMKVSDGSLRIR